jgi:predicted signal transduction protein with EAL and GGDEF domain
VEILGDLFQIGASVGIAMFPADARTSVDLIKHADTAMYAAKGSGRNTIRFFSPEDDFAKARMSTDIREAKGKTTVG